MTEATARVPLRSLSPQYDAAEHADYVEILTTELIKTDDAAPRNIALTGHYGSGKSSVLLEVQKQLEQAKLKVINLSLPSLGIGTRSAAVTDGAELDTTNLIQKEIVKQLLYRRSPSEMPASRYNRLDTFDLKLAYRRAAGIGLTFTALAVLLRLPAKVESAFPSDFWTWVDDHLWLSISTSIHWLSLLAVFALAVAAAVWIQRLLQQRLRVTELGAGSAKVTLSEQSTSYFDEYLDEIVYFFQTSETSIVIFEDLDRFKDPHIFETLRELNLLLNNAAQTGTTPTRFVYAIRDSIFEQLDASDKNAGDEQVVALSNDPVETRRLTSTNRTKFFDLVVPMVPFISHRTSRDLIKTELGSIEDDHRPSNDVIDLVSVHLTDMRLIKNICNEYDVFRRRILRKDGLKELTADRLFASIVYKNLYLADYEDIRNGTSLLDTLYEAFREWVSQQTASARSAEQGARVALRRLDVAKSRSERLGKRLHAVLLARYPSAVKTENVQISTDDCTYDWGELLTPEFWRSYLASKPHMTVIYRHSPYQQPESVALDFKRVQSLMGEILSPEKWTEQDRAELSKSIASAIAGRREVAHASMAVALARPDKTGLPSLWLTPMVDSFQAASAAM